MERQTLIHNAVQIPERRKHERAARSAKPELRCVIALIRHGDRTPKEKMKIKVGSLSQELEMM